MTHTGSLVDGGLRLWNADLFPVDPAAPVNGNAAVGVVYHPEHEAGNYVPTQAASRYDAVVHVERSTALHPLRVHVDRDTVPDLYPWGT